MKRFWSEVAIVDRAISLDGRPVRTPVRAPLVLPTDTLAEAVAAEWRAVSGDVDPRAMPLTGLANAAIDRADADLATGLPRYAEHELLAYRADEQAELAAREAEVWDPLLDWARRRYDVAFSVTAGVLPVAQPAATVARLGSAIAVLDPFRLAAMQPIVTIGGSIIVALALLEGEIGGEAAFDACHLDELWQVAQWGEDYLAAEARAARREDFLVAVRMLALLDAP